MVVPAESIKLDRSVQNDPPPPKPKRFMHADLALFNRRKRLLLLYHSGNLNSYSLKALCNQLNENNVLSGITKKVTMAALYKDLQRMPRWEPFIYAMLASHIEAEQDAEEYLKFLKLAREKALFLMIAADNDSVKVCAIGKLIDVVSKEVRLRQSLGQLPNVERNVMNIGSVTQNQQFNIVTNEELLRQYDELVRRYRRQQLQGNDSSESMGKMEATDNC